MVYLDDSLMVDCSKDELRDEKRGGIGSVVLYLIQCIKDQGFYRVVRIFDSFLSYKGLHSMRLTNCIDTVKGQRNERRD